MTSKIEQLQNIIDSRHSIIFFTGAGTSTDSGIPDFRSQDGLYYTKYDYPPESIIEIGFFNDNPQEFYRFYKDKMMYLDAKPNYTHKFIAKLEQQHKSLGVITQNIDGLHQAAGSKHVYELHGSIHRNYCTRCGKFFDAKYVKEADGVPRCDACGGLIKPDVVLYGEGLSSEVLRGAVAAIQSADTMIILGTSLVVYPAAGLVRYFGGKNLVLINKSTTPYDSSADLLIQDTFNNVLPKIRL